jgi:replicative DNA helicase
MAFDRVGERGRRNPQKTREADPSGQKLPHSEESERAVLASILLAPSLLGIVAERVVVSDFYIERHQLIFQAMLDLEESGKEIDLRTLQGQLDLKNSFEAVGGIAYLASLDLDLPDLGRTETYTEIVKERSIRRQLIDTSQQIIANCLIGGSEATEILAVADRAISALAERAPSERTMRALPEVINLALDEAQRAESAPDEVCTPTGWRDFDRVLNGGLKKGRSYVVAGQTGMGKTSFLHNLAVNVAGKTGTRKACVLFSLEMPAEEVGTCLISQMARVHKGSIASGQLSANQWDCLVDAQRRFATAGIYVDDDSSVTPSDLARRVKQLKATLAAKGQELAFVGVDYLGLMEGGGRHENRQVEIASISRRVKMLSKSLDVAMVVLCQLNRQTERRSDPRPVLADLRESGAIANDADAVILLYRDEVYHKDDPNTQGMAEWIIAKLRGGETGTLHRRWRGEYGVFEEIDQHHQTEIPR